MGRILHLEGLFGSGKSTAAEDLADSFLSRGLAARWHLEESGDHPIRTEYVRHSPKDAEYPEVLLREWHNFLEKPSDHWLFLDGYAFQSTIRFLFEHQYPRTRLDAYFDAFTELAADRHQLLYLYVKSPREHMKAVVGLRGPIWTDKVTAYVAGTPYGKAHNLKGVLGLIDYWERYQELCLELLSCSTLRHAILPAMSHDWCLGDVPVIVRGDLDKLK